MQVDATVSLRSGRRMPVLGLGTWQLRDNTAATIAYALELGYRLLDTSGDYGTQRGLGDGLRQSGVERERVYVVTKVEEIDDAYAATVANLDELGLEYADLVLVHRPPRLGPGESLWEGLLRARQDRLARDVGVSNYSVDHLRELADACGEMPGVNQIEWSPFGHDERMLTFCREHGVVLQAYSPLTRGERLGEESLRRIAKAYGKTPAQLILRWNIQHGVVPLPKASQRRHLEENIALFDFDIGPEHMAELDAMNEHYSALGARLTYL
jgi:2,5-diketo-D-gluconate reductase A